jgi:transmembrane sensor
MNYLEYSVEDFVLDEYFQKWICENDPMVTAFWRTWLDENPHKRAIIEEASQIVRSVSFKEDIPLGNEFNQTWNNVILNRKGGKKQGAHGGFRSFRWNLPNILKIAAILVVGAFIGLRSINSQKSNSIEEKVVVIKNITKRTGVGEKLTFQLSDGSLVKLNSNSSLTFPELFVGNERRVNLKGEAFFEITKNKNQPFQVLTGNLGTQVLGTSFNVRAYKPETETVDVAVVSGKVAVGAFMGNHLTEELLLTPGQMTSYDQNQNTFKKTSFVYDEVIGWKDGILNFNNQGIMNIVKTLESWYDVKIILDKENLDLDKDFSGIYKNKTLDTVLKGLSYAYGFKYEMDNKIVIIK